MGPQRADEQYSTAMSQNLSRAVTTTPLPLPQPNTICNDNETSLKGPHIIPVNLHGIGLEVEKKKNRKRKRMSKKESKKVVSGVKSDD